MPDSIVRGFDVPFEFPTLFTRGAWVPQNRAFVEAVCRLEPQRRHRVLVVIDANVATANPGLEGKIRAYCQQHSASLELVAPPVIVPGGEAAKNDVTHPFAILQRINECGIDRQSFVVVIGGGAVLDMVSFAAAIAHRGVRVIRFPTTVLSQADSGVGVKNSINFFGKKNFVGTFVPPFAVINDFEFLDSLDPRDRIAGVVEAIKVALLRDPAFYCYMERHAAEIAAGRSDVIETLVQRSAELHLAHICGNGDPFEFGSARPLDFGHWAAHKLESMTSHRLRHGEAVSIGIALDLTYSVRKEFLDRHTCERILSLLLAVGLPITDSALFQRDATGLALISGLREFREHLGGELHITLLRGIGESFEVTEMDEALVCDSILQLGSGPRRRDVDRYAPRRASAAG
jgi:3-dehydroquinate synthase